MVLWDLKSKKADYRYMHDEVSKRPMFPFFTNSIGRGISHPQDICRVNSHIQKQQCQNVDASVQLCVLWVWGCFSASADSHLKVFSLFSSAFEN